MIRVPERWRRLSTFAASSVIATLCSELVLVVCYGVIGLPPTVSSVIAWFAGAVPNFTLNRAWTWQASGRPSLRRELLPYVAIVVATLLLAMLATHTVDRLLADAEDSVRTALVAATFFGVYVFMFLLRYFLLSRLYSRTAAVSSGSSS
jgi:putative flippase GtrA